MRVHYEDIWREPWEHSIRRWRTARGDESLPPADTIAEAAAARSQVLMRHTTLKSARELTTPRQWEAYWNAEEERRRITGAIERLGWRVRLSTGLARSSMALHEAQEAGDGNVALVEVEALETLFAALAGASCPYPLTLADLVVIQLAEELLAISGARTGKSKLEPWLEPLAVAHAQRVLLGLPFSPLAFQLLGK